jgi:menaquinone-dependent protoporphyrinogen oxidase
MEALPEQKIADLSARTEALGHHVFAGRLDRSELSMAERLVAKAVHAPDGDFRDWADIHAWADQIADTLT